MRILIIKIILNLTAYTPLIILHFMASFLGWLFWFIPNETKNTVIANIEHCFPELAAIEKKRLMRQTIIENIKCALEMGLVWMRDASLVLEKVKGVTGQVYMDEAIAKGNGVILILPHLGMWEITGLYMAKSYPFTALYRKPKLESLDQLIMHARQRNGATLLPADTRGVRGVFSALKKGNVVGILPDQAPSKGMGVFANFFSHLAYTMVLLPRLAIKTNASVVCCFVERYSFGRGFHVHFLPLPEEMTGKTVEQGAEIMNSGIEACVNICPAQYQWAYK